MSRPPLILGTAQLGDAYGIANQRGALGDADVAAMLDAAVEAGIRAFDTAPAYGASEARLGQWLRRRGAVDGLRIGSKLPTVAAVPAVDLAVAVRDAVEASRSRLGVDTLDPFLLHDAGDLRVHGAALLDALCAQREHGAIGRIGASVYDVETAVAAAEFAGVAVLQHPVSLLDRRMIADPRRQLLRIAGVEVHARSVFLQGLLLLDPEHLPAPAAPARPALRELQAVLASFGVGAADVALAFVCGAGVDAVVFGAETPEQVWSAVDAVMRPLPGGLQRRLAALAPPRLEVIDPRRWVVDR